MTEPIVTQVTLDDADLRILAQLQRDAALTNQDLAERAHVSPATCLRRVRRLVECGLILRRVALLAPDALGPHLQVVCEVTLDRQGAEHLEAFEQVAVAHPAVRECYRVSPGPDFVLVAVAADMAHWGALVSELLTQNRNVRNVKSFFVVRRAKFDPSWPLPAPSTRPA
jgi:Lrp/AsnC family transcriptional regulator, leucine-responsive regulatory protein